MAGSPRKPRPIEAMVMPTCAADRYSSIWSISFRASVAPVEPSLESFSRCPARERTSANSAATKNPLMTINRTSRKRKKAVTRRGA